MTTFIANSYQQDVLNKSGKLRAEMSNGKCLFVMVQKRKWEWIDSLLS